jgi:hypothetical protein
MPGVRAMRRQLCALSKEMDISALSAEFRAGADPLSIAAINNTHYLIFEEKFDRGLQK